MAFQFHSGLRAAVRDIEVRPVKLPWTYIVLEGDGVPYPAGTECAIELDVPRIEREEWAAVLNGASVAPIEKRAAGKSMAGFFSAAAAMDEANREKAAEALLERERNREEALARQELVGSTSIPTLLRADCDRLCANGAQPAPILSVIKSGRLVAITRRETERLKMLANPAIPEAIRDSAPLQQDEMQPRDDLEPWVLDKPSLASVFRPDTGRALPSAFDLFSAPAEPAHVGILRYLVWSASDHRKYEERLGEKKSLPAGGEGGEKALLASKPPTRQRRSSARPKK